MGFWDTFSVYNQKKHSTNPEMFGTNHSNLGEGKTSYIYSREYQEPNKKKVVERKEVEMNGDQIVNMRNSVSSSESGDKIMMNDSQSHMVDISNLSQTEFKKLYDGMRKGEPDNKVNF